VHATGDGATWKYYYHEDPEAKRQRRKFSQVHINEKVALAVEKKTSETKEVTKAELVREAVQAAIAAYRSDFASMISTLIPAIVDWTKQNPDKRAEDFPIPSFVGSNSVNIVPAPAPATAPAPAPTHSSLSSVSGVFGGASTLAELDALTVITHRTLFNISIIFHFHCLSDV
jgi:hypothetical protein